MNIIVDAMGGDKPEEIIKGALLSAKDNGDMRIIVTGDEQLIRSVMAAENAADGLIDIVAADEVITNDDVPTIAVKNKKNSSMVKGCYLLRDDNENIGIISSGSTGALLTSATLILGRLPNIFRPTMVSFLPTVTGGLVALADCGANVDSRPEYLLQYGIMASHCFSALCGVESPRVALLNVGTEDKKGNTLTHETFPLLKSSGLNFMGNMEARDACGGNYDVLVADGFDGNILLKSIEGTVSMFSKMLKQQIMQSAAAKFGYLFTKGAINKLKSRMDFNNYGGAVFLGVKKLVIKAHGSSKAGAIYNSVKQIRSMYDGGVIGKIEQGITPQA